MNTLLAIDTLNNCWYELFGLAGIIDHLAEAEMLLTQEQLDYLGTAAERISRDIHHAADVIYKEYRRQIENPDAKDQ